MTTIHIAQGPGAEDITVPQLFAGETPAVQTRDVAFLAAQGAIPQYTPLMYSAATGTYIAWVAVADPTAGAANPVSAVAAYAIPDQAVDQRCAVYVGGCFNVDAIAWPASTTEVDVEAALNATRNNANLTFRKLLWSSERVDKTDLDVGPGNQPPEA